MRISCGKKDEGERGRLVVSVTEVFEVKEFASDPYAWHAPEARIAVDWGAI